MKKTALILSSIFLAGTAVAAEGILNCPAFDKKMFNEIIKDGFFIYNRLEFKPEISIQDFKKALPHLGAAAAGVSVNITSAKEEYIETEDSGVIALYEKGVKTRHVFCTYERPSSLAVFGKGGKTFSIIADSKEIKTDIEVRNQSDYDLTVAIAGTTLITGVSPKDQFNKAVKKGEKVFFSVEDKFMSQKAVKVLEIKGSGNFTGDSICFAPVGRESVFIFEGKAGEIPGCRKG